MSSDSYFFVIQVLLICPPVRHFLPSDSYFYVVWFVLFCCPSIHAFCPPFRTFCLLVRRFMSSTHPYFFVVRFIPFVVRLVLFFHTFMSSTHLYLFFLLANLLSQKTFTGFIFKTVMNFYIFLSGFVTKF